MSEETRELVVRVVVGTVSAAAGIAAVAAIVALATGNSVSGAIAAAYYIVGAILFLIGMFPTGGFSLIRGTITRRRPVGSRQEPVFLLGLVLIGLGIVVDVMRF
jgi:hypothetical protein